MNSSSLTFQENLTASENHKGWTLRIDGSRIGEIYPQDEDGKGGAAVVEALQASFRRAERIEALLSRMANVHFGFGFDPITEADRVDIVEALAPAPLVIPAICSATHNGNVLIS